MTPRRALSIGAGVLLVALVVYLGRWSAHRADASQLAGIAAIERRVGALDGKALDAYRVTPSFDCLLYRVGARNAARELCFDGSGRLIEAIDRTGSTPVISSVRYEPGLSRIQVSPSRLLPLFRRVGAGPYLAGVHDRLPLGNADLGPVVTVKPRHP